MTLLGLAAVLAMTGTLLFLLRRDQRLRRAARRSTPEPSEGRTLSAPVEETLDLHGFAPGDVLAAVRAYLDTATDAGLCEVRLIHGKGQGVQRGRVQGLLSEHPCVEDFRDAPPQRGGWGATVVWLRPRIRSFSHPDDRSRLR
ncbi:MAG: Smr/MutS family protein [Myxococcota bacterium]